MATHGTLSPKQATEVMSSANYETVKRTMARMAKDGQLKADRGTYTLGGTVSAVPVSLSGEEDGDNGTPGTTPLRDTDDA